MGRAVALPGVVHSEREPRLHLAQPGQAQPSSRPEPPRGEEDRRPAHPGHRRHRDQRTAGRAVQPRHRLGEAVGQESPAHLLREHGLRTEGAAQLPSGLRPDRAGDDGADGLRGQGGGRRAAAYRVDRNRRLRDRRRHRLGRLRRAVPPGADGQGPEDRDILDGDGAQPSDEPVHPGRRGGRRAARGVRRGAGRATGRVASRTRRPTRGTSTGSLQGDAGSTSTTGHTRRRTASSPSAA